MIKIELTVDESRTIIMALQMFLDSQQFLNRESMENAGIDVDELKAATKNQVSIISEKIYVAARVDGYNIGKLVQFGLDKEIER